MTTEENEFSAAFAEFTGGAPAAAPVAKTPEELAAEEAALAQVKTPEQEAAEAAAAVVAASNDADQNLAGTGLEKSAEELAAEAAAEAAAQAAAPGEISSPSPEVQALLAEIEALKAAQAAKPAVAEPAPMEPEALYTAEEQEVLTKHVEDWAEVSKGEALLRRAEYKRLLDYVFDQVHEYYAPLQDFFQTRSGKDQYSEIVALVPDYDTVRDKALAWINVQPPYLKDAYTAVANEGSPKDIADMISRFKSDTKYVAPVGQVTPIVSTPQVTPALPVAVVKAARALAVVKSARSEQGTGPDENDYEGAFVQYAREEEARAAARK